MAQDSLTTILKIVKRGRCRCSKVLKEVKRTVIHLLIFRKKVVRRDKKRRVMVIFEVVGAEGIYGSRNVKAYAN